MTMSPFSFVLLVGFSVLLSLLDHREKCFFDKLFSTGNALTEGEEKWFSEIIKQISDQDTFVFSQDKACWTEWRGIPYLFFCGYVSYSMSGWRFRRYQRDRIRCLVPTTESARKLLLENPRMFRMMAGTNQAAIFYIRRLSEFAKEIQG